jgi:uncharacterized membrane protein
MIDMTLLHPMIVHFPIALLITGFLADLIGISFKKEFFNNVGLLLLSLGVAGVAAAYLTGDRAGEGLTEAGALKMALEAHEAAAELTLWILAATILARGTLVLMRKYSGALRLIPLALFLIGILSIARTGYYGGELVFKHAAGVQLQLGLGAPEASLPAQGNED